MAQIEYTDKVTGGTFTAADANEIKTVVNANEIKKVTVTLSSEEILTGTVKEVLAAPGSGKYINIVSANLFYKHGGTDYVGDYYPILDYVNTLNEKTYFVGMTAISSATSFHMNLYDQAAWGSGGYNVIDNKGLYLGLNDTPTTGNGTLKLDILYTIEDY